MRRGEYGGVYGVGQGYVAKRMECVQLAGAFGEFPLNKSASKLDALHTFRVKECLHSPVMRHRKYDPKHSIRMTIVRPYKDHRMTICIDGA
jgi:hypothetical protein